MKQSRRSFGSCHHVTNWGDFSQLERVVLRLPLTLLPPRENPCLRSVSSLSCGLTHSSLGTCFRKNFSAPTGDPPSERARPLGGGPSHFGEAGLERNRSRYRESLIVKFQAYYHANVFISPRTPPNPLLQW